MSIRVMTSVWDHGPDKQGHLLVMLALADYSNDQFECWPSMKSIAEKARMTERGVQKILRQMEADDWLSVKTGSGRGGCNKYKLNASKLSNPREARQVGDYNRLAILRSSKHTCLYCGYKGVSHGQEEGCDLDLDHIIATSLGGSDVAENIAVSCKPCNQAKKSKTVFSWVAFMAENPELYSGEWRSDERLKPRTRVQETPNKDAETLNGGSPEPSRTVKEPSVRVKTPVDVLCEIVRRETADDFAAHRKALRKPLTHEAAKRLVIKLANHPDPDAVFDLSIENGWQGVFPEKTTGGQNDRPANKSQRRMDAFIAGARRT